MTPAGRHRRNVRRSTVGLWCDRWVTASLVFVVVFGPFAFGAVHPQSFGLLELAAGVVLLAWISKLLSCRRDQYRVPTIPSRLWMPAVGFLAVAAFQLVPLPPVVIGVVSPATYELYATILPGWPEEAPYETSLRRLLDVDADGIEMVDLQRPIALLSAEEVATFEVASVVPDAWGRLPGEPLLAARERARLESWVERDHDGFTANWRPLSMSPAATFTELLKILAYLALFCVATFYPMDQHGREDPRFQRTVLRAIAFTAVAVALVGLLQRLSWNGKILWFFVPWDWGRPHLDLPQTSGPFVSRNNFGGYLAMTLPLLLIPVLASTPVGFRGRNVLTKLTFGLGSAVAAIALLFSLSRGSWIASGVSLAFLLGFVISKLPEDRRASFLRTWRSAAIAGIAVGAVVLLLVLLPMGGSELGSDLDRRLGQTVSDTASWTSRVGMWKSSLKIFADFPVFGVGLGAWGTVFPKYDESFFFGSQARRAHNDYLQLFSETGLVGGVLLVLAVAFVSVRLLRAMRDRPARPLAMTAAILAGLLALAVHELVDFDLQMPGIAVTAVILFGIALRGSWRFERRGPVHGRVGVAAIGGVGAYVLLVLLQVPEHPNRPAPTGIVDALDAIDRRPSDAPAHVALGIRLAEAELALAQPALDVAVALRPTHPSPRDARAVLALRLGDEAAALADIEESTFRAPVREQHPLLASSTASWLSAKTRHAAETGFRRAVKGAGYRAAIALAGFYSGTEDRQAAAEAWKDAAELSPGRTYAAALLRRASFELRTIGQWSQAEALLRQSIELDPSAWGSRAILVAQILGRRADLKEAQRQVEAGIAAGADPYELELALAEAGRIAGNTAFERASLKTASRRRPSDVRGHYRLGLSWYREGRWDAAAQSFAAATRVSGDYAPAWFYLGLASEQAYRFEDAKQAFTKAAAYAPSNPRYREHRDRFTARLDAS